MSKRFAYVILSLLAIAIVLLAFVMSPLATPAFRWAATTLVDGLEIEDVSGSLYSGLKMNVVDADLGGTQLSIEQIDFAIDWECTHSQQVCLSQLLIVGPNIQLTDAESEQPQTDEKEQSLITLPIAMDVQSLQVSKLSVNSDTLIATLNSFATELSFSQTLTLKDTKLNGFTFESLVPPAPPKPFRGITYSVPEIPNIWVPVSVQLNNFDATDLALVSNNEPQRINQISFRKLLVEGRDIEWEELAVIHPQGEAKTSGNVVLADEYPLNIELETEIALPEDQTQHVELNAQGSLADLTVKGALKGLVIGSTELNLALLDEFLPINGSISWPQQSLNHPQFTSLEEGTIGVSGKLGNYKLLASSGATLPSLERIDIEADVVLTETALNVNTLNTKLLGGEVQTQGNVSFVDGLKGTGATHIDNINATSLLNTNVQAGVPKASWQYVIQQSEDGINLLITDLSADVEYDGNYANVSGQAVYAQGQDLAVATLNAVQQETDNTVKVIGQVLNQRVINVNSDISLPNLSALVSDIQGDLTGNVTIKGNWNDPQFNVDIDTSGIRVGESLSPLLKEQGAITTSIHGGGSLSAHSLSIDATLKDYSASFDFLGGLNQQQYTSEVNRSAINVLNTQWQLEAPFSLSYNLEQQSATVNKHCWNLVEDEGSLCLNRLDYTKQLIEWDVLAKRIPIGKWVEQTVALVTRTSDSARFAFNSAGTYSQESGLIAKADISVTPSTWTINQENPIPLTIDKLNGNVVVDNTNINLTAAFASTELGNIDFDFSGASQDWFAGKINGQLLLDNVQLQPLEKISPSIYQLAGTINGNIIMSGDAKRPALDGELTLENGIIDVEQSPLSLANWNQSVYLNGQQADLDGEFILGDGSGSLIGILSWKDEPFAELSLDADQISIEHEEIMLAVSPDLEAHIKVDEVIVDGDINIPKARIKIEALPENAVTPSRDVYLRGEPESTDPIKNIIADINLHIDEDKTQNVKLDAFGLTANLHGELQIKNQPSTVGYGDLQILDGRYKAYGQNLIIQTGEVQFNGPIGQPFLFVEAIRDPELTDDGVIAGVRIEGAASKPTVSLFSEPAMEQSQNLLYLIYGAGNLNGESSDSYAYKAALVGFGLSSSGTFTGSIGEALGIEDLSFTTTGQGENTQVSMTGNLNDRLSVRFGVGLFDNSQEVAIRYQLLPQLYIEAIQRLSTAVSLIDLYYEFSLGDPTEQDKPEENTP